MDRRRILVAAVAGVALAGWGSVASAAPYAAAITEAGGNVTFTLNDAADDVTVIRDGVPTSLGAQGLGSHTFARNGAANYQIVVNKNAGPGFLNATAANVGVVNRISDDNPILQFERAVGIAVNKNPATPALFGRVYVSDPLDALTASGRLINEGIFILGPDLSDPFGQQDTVGNVGTGFKAGLDSHFANGGSASPWKIELDRDGNLYIADWSDAEGTVWRTSPDVGNSGGVNVLAGNGGDASVAAFGPTATHNHGSVAGMVLSGSASTGDLTMYTVDEDMSPNGDNASLNDTWKYNLGSTTHDFAGIPQAITQGKLLTFVPGGVIADIARGSKDGKLYLMQSRSAGNEAGVFVTDANGNVLYDSKTDSLARGLGGGVDLFKGARGIDVTADQQYLAVATNVGGDTWVVPLLDGIPDLPNALLIDTFSGSTNDDASFDAAGNLYVGNRSSELVREFVGGGVSQTVYNSNGTFKVLTGPTWTATGGGNYSTGGNWLLGSVPNAKSAMATFQGNTAPATVTLDAPATVGNVRFDSPNSFTIAGTNTLTLDSFGEPRVTVLSGSHSITAPVVATQNTQFTVAQGSTLTVSNFTLNSPTANITTAGGGVTALNNYRAAALNVNNGSTARVIANGTNTGASNVKALNIAGAADAWTGTLDLTNNAMVVDWPTGGNNPSTTIQNQLKSGYAGGAWTGKGINSSTAAANASSQHKTALGWANSAGTGTFFGQPVDADSVLIRYTYTGDANIDGKVDTLDFNALAANFGGTGKIWSQADFNYDGTVDTLDFNNLAANFGQQISEGGGGAGALVPEPASLGLAGLALAGLARRRRR